ncbi:ferredoxin reductase family protein [Uliginosibacterium gangwonense]|uniref:ferredoxin reductase family protein n=1 Tax=Uliginosibacterium gangwonense TaxID=392736 RepID=UPI000363AE4B|nr:ferric reductase-like transmembrane domain-containing protein [Uliginosibacterium gangwonense]
MKRFVLPTSLLVIVLWAAMQPIEVLTLSASFLPMRVALNSLTGALALSWMGLCMLFALRPIWLESRMGGLDKLYRVHKHIGIGALLLVVAHWLTYLSPNILMDLGWIENVTGPSHHHGRGSGSLTGGSRELGEVSAILVIALSLVALLRFVPYGWFRKLHKGFPVAFLLGAIHSVVLMPHGTTATPFRILVAVISLTGSAIAIRSLAGLIGRSRQHKGEVSSIAQTESGVLDLQVMLRSDWPGHKDGQFALLTLDRREGAHPFTIASHWERAGHLRFGIKPLGDYTRKLKGNIKCGDAVIVEGPYGGFDFGDVSHNQVWVAGGVGITAFLARLEMLAQNGNTKNKIHFFYSVSSDEEASFPCGLEDLCTEANVKLHLRVVNRDGRIESDDIAKFVAPSCEVFFCGPSRWAEDLLAVLQQRGRFSLERFHREFFEFR